MNCISDEIIKHKNSNKYPLHMPGHKQNYDYGIHNLVNIDYTEVAELDNLNNPTAAIKRSEERISRLYKSDHSCILTNGSTVGIFASIFATVNCGDTIIVTSNCHRSVNNCVEILKCEKIIIHNHITNYNMYGGINIEDLEKIIKENIDKEIKAVLITSPTYEGLVLNINEIANLVHRYGITLIVDEAHGAHFAITEHAPDSALQQGADIVVNSLHKTLPSLTQTAVLHVKGDRVDINKVRKYISMFQTSSPSYIFLYTIDVLMERIENNEIDFDGYYEKLIEFRKNINKNDKIKLVDKSIVNRYNISDIDITKLTFMSNYCNGVELYNYFDDNGFLLEYATDHFALGITTVADKNEMWDSLLNVIKKFNNTFDSKTKEIQPLKRLQLQKVDVAAYNNTKIVNLKDAEGLVLATDIIPYPPGIPIACTGDVINCELIKYISNINKQIQIIGVVEGCVTVYE